MDNATKSEFIKVWRALRCKASCKSVKPYKSYMVSLTQDSNNEPVVFTTFENTLDVVATFSYSSAGNYLVLFDKPIFQSPFDYVTLSGSFGSIGIGAVPVFYDALFIQTSDGGTPQDNILGHYYPNILEIRVYNS